MCGSGEASANYDWWGKNKVYKVSKKFKIPYYVVMVLKSPNTIKLNKKYNIKITFKDNHNKKLKLNIPSLLTTYSFNGKVKNNKLKIKGNNVVNQIYINVKRNQYVLKVKCDDQIITKNYYFSKGKFSSKKPVRFNNYVKIKSLNSKYSTNVFKLYKFINKLDKKELNKIVSSKNTKNNKFSNNKITKFLLSNFLKLSKGFKSNSSRSDSENGALLISYICKKSPSIAYSKNMFLQPKVNVLTTSLYIVGALTEGFINCNGNPIAFLKYPFLTIPKYSKTLNSWGYAGQAIKLILDVVLDIDENGNLSIGNLAVNLLSLTSIGLAAKGIKILSKFKKLNNAINLFKQSGIGRFLCDRGAKILSYVSDGLGMITNPAKTIATKIITKVTGAIKESIARYK